MFKFTNIVAAFSQKTALIIGLIFVSAAAYAQQPIDISRELDKLPAFKLLIDKHPEIRAQLTADIGLVAKGGAEGAAAQLRLNALIQNYFGRYAAQASNESVIGFVDQLVAILDDVKVKSPGVCREFIGGQGGMAANSIDPATTNKMLDAMAKVIETGIRTPQTKPTLEWAQPRLMKAMQVIFDKKDPNFTADFFNPNTAPYQICHSVALIYRTIKETLPQEEVGPVFRAMFGSLSNM